MELEIIDYASDGGTIAKKDGKVYFISGGLVGEIVDVNVKKQKSQFCFCDINKVIKSSPLREKPICPHFGTCGGCNYMHTPYENSLNIKKQVTQNTLNKISKLNIKISNAIKSEPLNYRNKMVFAISPKGDLCMHAKDGSLFEVDNCYLAATGIMDLAKEVSAFIKGSHLKGYDAKTGSGLLKFLVIRCLDDRYLITLVATKSKVDNIESLVDTLKSKGYNFGLYINVNNTRGSLILTSDFVKVCGLDYIESSYKTLSGKVINYPISPESFLQVNDKVKNSIYAFVENALSGYNTIIDAYSGAGLMTAILSTASDQVVGIEIVKSACDDAIRLKQDNNIVNMEIINADCSVGLGRLPQKLLNGKLALVLDPPRKGVDEKVIDAVIKLKPGKIVYISCNPATLARDISKLSTMYDIESVDIYDMFALTAEVESVCTLTKKENV